MSCGHEPAKAPEKVTVATSAPAREPFTAELDRMLEAEWKKQGVIPAPVADDATYLRRVSLDIVGDIPSPEALEAFLANSSPTKRKDVVRTLLASPAYAAHWANYWDDVLMGNERGGPVDRGAFHGWLAQRFASNTHWNALVAELVSANGQNSLGGARGQIALGISAPAKAPMPMEAADDTPEAANAGTINPPVNYTLRFFDAPQDLAGNASRVFLGVQIQCAQCHDHKTEKWKTTDFEQLTSSFWHLQAAPVEPGKEMGIKRLVVSDAARVQPRLVKKADTASIARAEPIALDGTKLSGKEGATVRQALASWITSRDNPWFSKAIVNRMWGHFLGRGFVDPVDDIRPTNPAVLPEALDGLATWFAGGDFDLASLIETITATRAYQLAAAPGGKTDEENLLYAKFRLVPLGPDELMHAVFSATDVEGAASAAGLKNLSALRYQIARSFAFVFDVDEEMDSRRFEGSVTEALVLMNGAITNSGSRVLPGTALQKILKKEHEEPAVVRAIYLRVLSRVPTESEVERVRAALKEARAHANDVKEEVVVPAPAPVVLASPKKKGEKGEKKAARAAARDAQFGKLLGAGDKDPEHAVYEDLFWALLNSSEFLFNR